MSIEDKSLENFGRQMAKDIGAGSSPEELKCQEEAFVSLVSAGMSSPARRLAPVLSAAAALAIGLASLYFFTRPDSLSFRIGQVTSERAENVWVKAPTEEPLPVYFADGSQITLNANTAMRVVRADVDEVYIDLSQGEIDAMINSGGETRWTMHAGPYRMTVLGTSFTANWTSSEMVLDVTVHKGVVLVQGAGLNDHGIKLAAGDVLHANGKRRLVSLNTITRQHDTDAQSWSSSIDRSAVGTPDQDRQADPKSELTIRPDSRSRGKLPSHHGRSLRRSPAGQPTWIELYQQDRYGEAIDRAKAQGLDQLMRTSSKRDLWYLADAARNAGQLATATNILTTYRRRFSRSPKAHLAAFLLGRIAFEHRRNPARAARWFKTYLNEAKNGPLAEEALGRLMVAYDEGGAATQAQKTARQYLSRHPKGSYAKLAKYIAGDGK